MKKCLFSLLALLLVAATARAGPILSVTLSGDFDKPTIRVDNLSTTGESVTQFFLTIGNASNNFDRVFNQTGSAGIVPTLVTPDTLEGATRDDFLFLTFSGFGPGLFWQFDAELDPDSVNGLVDYRTSFFTLNGPISPLTGNAQFGATFSNNVTLQDTLPNFPANTGNVYSVTIPQEQPPPVAPVPEPTTLVLWGTVLAAGGAAAWWRRRRATA